MISTEEGGELGASEDEEQSEVREAGTQMQGDEQEARGLVSLARASWTSREGRQPHSAPGEKEEEPLQAHVVNLSITK